MPAGTLTVADVAAFTGTTVTADSVSLAASLIDEQTAYTVDEHVDTRGVPALSVRAAWAMVAARVFRMMTGDDSIAVTSETQGDYQYSESEALAKSVRFSAVTDGRPGELLQVRRSEWFPRLMPLPAATESAANKVAAIVARFDAELDAYIADGGRPPSVSAVIRQIRPLLLSAVSAALADSGAGDVPARTARDDARSQQTAIQTAMEAAVRDARRLRRQVPSRLPEQDDDETVAAFVRRVGRVAAVVAIAAKSRRPVRATARRVGVRLQRPTAAHTRMVIRTESAIARNRYTAKVVEERGAWKPGDSTKAGEWAVFVEDARKGPTDQECEDVNRKWASADWIRAHPVEHPNCVAPGQPVTGSADVLAAWSRPFDGEFVTIVTAAGREITVTPNHPILTSHGFHPAKSIKPGTEVVCYLGGERLGMSVPDNVERPPMIEEVVDALVETGGVGSGRMPATPEQFYGDGTSNGDVNVVWTDRFLWGDVPELVKVASKSRLITGQLSDVLFRECSGVQVGGGACHPSHGIMGGSGDRLATFGADALHVESFGVRSVAGLSPSTQPAANGGAVTSEVAGDHVGRFPAFISSDDVGVDRVVRVEVSRRQTVVHDLSTSEGWFACSSIIVANCTRRGRVRRLPSGAHVTLIE